MKQIYTDSNVIELSRHYPTLKDFRNACPSAYKYASRNGLLPSLTWLGRIRRPKGTLSYSFCRQVALQFSTVKEFRERCLVEYVTSANHGWLKRFKWLVRMDHKWDRKTVTGIARQYNTLREFRRAHNDAYHYAARQGLLDSFRWLKRVRRIPKSNKRS